MSQSATPVPTWKWLQSLMLAGYLMLAVAVANGYPIVYNDTGEYLLNSFTFAQSPYRSVLYSVFIRLVSWGMTPWLIIQAQCGMTVFVVYRVFRYSIQEGPHLEAEPVLFLGAVIFLASGTSLPWYVGQIMPDVFSSLAFLSVFLLLYDGQLSREMSVLLAMTLAVSVGCHLSNFISIGLVLSAVLVIRVFDRARQLWPVRPTKEIVAFVLLPIVLSASFITVSNVRNGYGLTLSSGTPVFLLARSIESGLAVDYLEQECQVEQLTPCKHLGDLRYVGRNEILWGDYPLLTEMGGWIGARKEAGRIVAGTIRRYPIRFLTDCAKQMVRQFLVFRPATDEDVPVRGYTLDVLSRIYPGDVGRFELTRQWSGRLSLRAAQLYRVYEAVFWICLCTGVIFLATARSSVRAANRLFIFTLIFLPANALVTGAVSGVENRYQNRVNWLVALCTVAYVTPVLSRWWGERQAAIKR